MSLNRAKSWAEALRIFLPLFFGVLAAAPALAADLPELKERIDSAVRPLGTGSCKTTRTGVWRVDGGIVVEIAKPSGRCVFESLELVVGQDRIKLAAVDNSFYFGKRNSWVPATYEWYRGNSGKVFFATTLKVEVENIRGIMEIGCTNENCLYEETAR